MQMEKIAKKDQANALHCYWVMMKECESQAQNNEDIILMIQVEGFFRLWNKKTGDNQTPLWIETT